MKRLGPLLTLALIAVVAYIGYSIWTGRRLGKPITGLVGYSPYNTSAMPSSPAGQSHTFGMSVQAR